MTDDELDDLLENPDASKIPMLIWHLRDVRGHLKSAAVAYESSAREWRMLGHDNVAVTLDRLAAHFFALSRGERP